MQASVGIMLGVHAFFSVLLKCQIRSFFVSFHHTLQFEHVFPFSNTCDFRWFLGALFHYFTCLFTSFFTTYRAVCTWKKLHKLGLNIGFCLHHRKKELLLASYIDISVSVIQILSTGYKFYVFFVFFSID